MTPTRPKLLAFLAIWATGLVALAVIVGFQARVDTQRRAQVVVETLKRQAGDVASVAFDPATAPKNAGPTAAQTRVRLAASESAIEKSVATISGLGYGREAGRLTALDQRYFATIDQIAAIVADGGSGKAAVQFGEDSRPTGTYGALLAELNRTGDVYADGAARSQLIGSIGTVGALVLLLLAFSIALYRAMWLTREKHLLLERSRIEALTDALTGLPNRRKLFLDIETMLGQGRSPNQLFALGMFDLDGFKAYNDTFGHPAGDALLARCGRKLASAVEGRGSAYRIGGDEFCVIVDRPDIDEALTAATAALSEHGEHFEVRCSSGSVLIAPNETTIEEALQQADQRLYNNKRSVTRSANDAHDVLVRVLAGYDTSLATHLSNLGTLAEAVARRLGLSDEEVALTKLTAELHDVGKTAIPSAILNKSGPLDADEWLLMKRHTIIGERILTASPALARVGPLVRATHERLDGTGYPDGLHGDQIPLSARIVAVVDAFDAMTNERPFGPTRTPRDALAELRRCSSSQFDPGVVEAFESVWQERLVGEHASAAPNQPRLVAA